MKLSTTLSALAIASNCLAQNPAISAIYTPDPAPYVHGDKVYLFSDGCSDQTGGEQKRRLMIQNFRAKLLEFSPMPFAEQKKAIEDLIFGWKGDLQQTDDISLLGFEIA